MKKRLVSILAAAAMIINVGCGSAPAQTAETAVKAAETAVQTTEANETSKTAETTTQAAETTTQVAESDTQQEEKKPGGPEGHEGQGGPGGQRGGGMQDKSSDTELQAMISEVAPKFELLTYEYAGSGIYLQYQLFVPENYDPSVKYPLLQFIPDSSVVGKGAETVLTQGWGGLVFASEEEQAKHPSFVLVPVFTDTVVNDEFEHSAQIDAAVRLIQSLTEEYSIDTDRIYTTGQSMGGMTSFYLNTAYPDLFAASLFVGSQWDNSILNVLEDKEFFYIVAAGDPRASEGQAGLKAVFDEDQAAYSSAEWSAKDPQETQNAAVEAMLAEGNNANFVTFTLGSTTADGSAGNTKAGEHMTSFDYAYKIEAVRDWLYSQSK
ncbi:MAG: hypothetical protein IKH70_02125 [Stomatobaculum sp.]|nr:hypothetical protein [Stomatobaculum sp.]